MAPARSITAYHFAALIAVELGMGLTTTAAQTEAAPDPPGILLDMSPEMGFIVPQARKEIRWLNQALVARSRQTVPVLEFSGAFMDRAGSLSVPARKNALYPLRTLLEERRCPGVYWITALRGQQSLDGLFEVESLFTGTESASRQLIIRHIWQDQAQAGATWVTKPPPPEEDPLDPENRPTDWYRLLASTDGYLIRSWLAPPLEYLDVFGFPHRIGNPSLLRKIEIPAGSATMDTRWHQDLLGRHGIHLLKENSVWPAAVTGRRWFSENVLIPHLDLESAAARDEAVFDEMRSRESIEKDLVRIPAKKLGVLFGFGYLIRDEDRLRENRKPGRDWRTLYLTDLGGIIRETRDNAAANEGRSDRVYRSEYVQLNSINDKPSPRDRYARAMAQMVRDDGVDAIYFFTNGYSGGGDYGIFDIDEPLIAAAIKEAGVRLYVRVPFELGVVPMKLQRLAMASGGGVFLGRAGDEDWEVEPPESAWPEASP